MKIIPEQVKYLREEIKKLRKELASYEQYYLERDKEVGTQETCMVFCGDSITEHQIAKNYKTLKMYEKFLLVGEYVRKPETDRIGIGTKFSLKFDGETTEENYTMVEVLIGKHMFNEAITIESPIGKSIIGKKVGEYFSYKIGSNDIRGIITKIKKNEKAYPSYIRDINKETQKSSDVVVITQSQKELLETELIRNSTLIVNAQEKNTVSNRIAEVKELLKNSKIASPSSDQIDVGTTFSITIFTDEGDITKRVELIEKAVSDELENDYIEKNSLFGLAVCGLKNQDEFIIHINQKPIAGVVYDISNRHDNLKRDDLSYQKSLDI